MLRQYPDQYIFKLRLSSKNLVWHILFGLIFFLAALDMQFTHYIFEQGVWSFESICGFLTGFIILPLLVIGEIYNYFSYTNSLKVTKESLTILGCFPSEKLKMIPWSEVTQVTTGDFTDGSFKGKKALKIILYPNGELTKNRKTRPILRWENGIISISSEFISEDLNMVANTMNYIKDNPELISENNQNFHKIVEELQNINVPVSEKISTVEIPAPGEVVGSHFKKTFIKYALVSSFVVPTVLILLSFAGIYDDITDGMNYINGTSRMILLLMGSLSAIPFNYCFKGYRLMLFGPLLIVYIAIALLLQQYVVEIGFFDIIINLIFGQSFFWLFALQMTIFSIYIHKDS